MVLSLENSINTGRGIPRVGPGVGPYTLSTRNYSICLYKNILTGYRNWELGILKGSSEFLRAVAGEEEGIE